MSSYLIPLFFFIVVLPVACCFIYIFFLTVFVSPYQKNNYICAIFPEIYPITFPKMYPYLNYTVYSLMITIITIFNPVYTRK